MDKKEEIIKAVFELFHEKEYHLCIELAEKVEIREKSSMLK